MKMNNTPLYDVRHITSIKDVLDGGAELYADLTAFLSKPKDCDKYQPITYKQYKDDVTALGTALLNLGLKGKRIALIGETRYEWVTSYMAVVCGLGIIVPLDKELPENEIESLILRSKADAIIFSGNLRESIANIAKRNTTLEYYVDMDLEADEEGVLSYNKLLETGRELLAQDNTDYDNLTIDVEKMSILLFTSATTDKSKAVMLSHKNICTNLMAMCTMVYIDKSDVFLSVLPLHHTYENTCGFLCALYRGATIAFCEGLRHIQKNLVESQATVILGVPLLFEAMYKRIWTQAKKNGLDKKLRTAIKISNFLGKFGIDVRRKMFSAIHDNFGGHLRLFISGAAAIDPSVSKGFREFGIHFIQGYGLTECSPIVALNRDVYYRDDSAGLPLPGLEVRVDNPDAEGIGEIIVKGDNVMLGYYEDDEANAKSLKDGWYYTGDLGYMDEENFVYLTGRKKNVIVTKNGKNIYPEEIEALLDKVPYIKESIVYGKMEEGDSDVTVAAAIVPDLETFETENDGRTPTEEEIYQTILKEVKAINKNLVTYKYIKDIQIRETEFAKTTTKKIKRYAEKL
jgi:long-chain acyl-CoA synthetase